MNQTINIQRIDINSSEFPERLREIPDPPQALYYEGDLSLLHETSVAVVGSRRHTLYGKNVALMIGRRLGECGVPVVSGLAYGIDAFAHQGALDAGGRVIGVLGSGIDRMTPRRNFELMQRGLAAGGLVVSEYEPGVPAERFTYPRRNRIISGLGLFTVVVEAGTNSGSLITAQHASEQGRPVYAVPGNINSQFSIGTNLLIRDGAYPLIVIDDLIRDLGLDPVSRGKGRLSLGEDERKVYAAVRKHGGATVDAVCRETGMSAAAAGAIVTVMEIKGILISNAGKVYIAE